MTKDDGAYGHKMSGCEFYIVRVENDGYRLDTNAEEYTSELIDTSIRYGWCESGAFFAAHGEGAIDDWVKTRIAQWNKHKL